MKKSKILVVGLIGLLLAGGLVLAGCEEEDTGSKCSDGGACYYDLSIDAGYGCGSNKCGIYIGRPKCNC